MLWVLHCPIPCVRAMRMLHGSVSSLCVSINGLCRKRIHKIPSLALTHDWLGMLAGASSATMPSIQLNLIDLCSLRCLFSFGFWVWLRFQCTLVRSSRHSTWANCYAFTIDDAVRRTIKWMCEWVVFVCFENHRVWLGPAQECTGKNLGTTRRWFMFLSCCCCPWRVCTRSIWKCSHACEWCWSPTVGIGLLPLYVHKNGQFQK